MIRFKQFFLTPFFVKNTLHFPLLCIFCLINGIVFFNAIAHHPAIGYDANDHLLYVDNVHEILTTFKLPAERVTKEFFSPPLPYAAPTLFYFVAKPVCEALGLGVEPYSDISYALIFTGKFGQLLNVGLSLLLTLYLLKICDLLRPGDRLIKCAALASLGMLPVYYKTFAFVRGEPYVAAFAVLAIYQVLKMLGGKTCRYNSASIFRLGGTLGALLLSRQWGFFLLPAIVLTAGVIWWRERRQSIQLLRALALSICLGLLLSGWFYLFLHFVVGEHFNRETPGFSLHNQPAKFYIGLGLDEWAVFTKPTRTAFRNQFFPVFYSDTWGDYWVRFSVTGYDPVTGYDWSPEKSNRSRIRPYLGRVNLISLLPTFLFLAGFIMGGFALVKSFRREPGREYMLSIKFALLALVVFVSLAGYFWFLLSYPHPNKGDTIKAAYMIQIFPFLSLLAGELIRRIREAAPLLSYGIAALLLLIFIHNLPALITHYSHFTTSW